jgi:hypothetical protein
MNFLSEHDDIDENEEDYYREVNIERGYGPIYDRQHPGFFDGFAGSDVDAPDDVDDDKYK